MNKAIGPLLIACMLFISCRRYKEVKSGEIGRAFILNSSPTFKGYYYEGSDDRFHYFISKWDWEMDRNFKILVDSLTIKDKYKFNLGEKEVRIDLFENDTCVFGQNTYYKIYIVK